MKIKQIGKWTYIELDVSDEGCLPDIRLWKISDKHLHRYLSKLHYGEECNHELYDGGSSIESLSKEQHRDGSVKVNFHPREKKTDWVYISIIIASLFWIASVIFSIWSFIQFVKGN